jgi:hypothetical protein
LPPDRPDREEDPALFFTGPACVLISTVFVRSCVLPEIVISGPVVPSDGEKALSPGYFPVVFPIDSDGIPADNSKEIVPRAPWSLAGDEDPD